MLLATGTANFRDKMNFQLSPLINSDFIFLSKRQWANESRFVCVMSPLIVFKQCPTPGAFSAGIIDPVSIYTIASRAFRTSIRSALEERVENRKEHENRACCLHSSAAVCLCELCEPGGPFPLW